MGTSSVNCFRSPNNSKSNNNTITTVHVKQSNSETNKKIWKQLLGLNLQKQMIEFSYENNVVHKTFVQIQKDLSRTYPESQYFQNASNIIKFEQILKKLAVFFPRTGYTQGMNFLAGFFLLHGFESTQAFTICVKVLTNFDMMCLGLYQQRFPLNRLYCGLVWQYLNLKEPKIKIKISNFNIIDQLWIFQWFMTFFVYSFPFQIIHDIWTFLFMNKQFALVRVAIVFILELWPSIQKCQNQIDFADIIQRLKNIKQFNKKFNIKEILKKAGRIQNEQIRKLINKTYYQQANVYAHYFNIPQNERKTRYIEIHAKWVQDRQQFLKNPHAYIFNRQQSETQMLNMIQISQNRFLHQSLVHNRRPQFSSLNQTEFNKMYQSDLHKNAAEWPTQKQIEKKQNIQLQQTQFFPSNLKIKRIKSNDHQL